MTDVAPPPIEDPPWPFRTKLNIERSPGLQPFELSMHRPPQKTCKYCGIIERVRECARESARERESERQRDRDRERDRDTSSSSNALKRASFARTSQVFPSGTAASQGFMVPTAIVNGIPNTLTLKPENWMLVHWCTISNSPPLLDAPMDHLPLSRAATRAGS